LRGFYLGLSLYSEGWWICWEQSWKIDFKFSGVRKTKFALFAVITNFDEDKGNADKEM
jgi:hypothetical protein